jgi:DNA-directed RNA polymerase subunit RPC12/RpoP
MGLRLAPMKREIREDITCAWTAIGWALTRKKLCASPTGLLTIRSEREVMAGLMVYRCECGSIVEWEPDEGDCEDDEIICPQCNRGTPAAESELKRYDAAAAKGTSPLRSS